MYIEDACGGSSPHPLEAAKSALHLSAEFVVCIVPFHTASSVCASAEVSVCWVGMRSEVVLGGCFWPSESHSGPVGREPPKKQIFIKKTRLIWRPFWDHFESLDAIKIALKFQCVSEGSFGRLWAHLGSQREPQRVRRGVILEHFGATSGNVKTMLPSRRNHHF